MAKVWNDSRFNLTCTQLRREIRGGHHIVVSDAQAELVPANGIFRVEFDKPVKRSAPKKAADDALEDKGGKIPETVHFMGGPKKNADAD